MAANQAKRRNESRLDAAMHPRAAPVSCTACDGSFESTVVWKTDLCVLFWARIERIPGSLIIKAEQASELLQLPEAVLAQGFSRAPKRMDGCPSEESPAATLQAALDRLIRSGFPEFVVAAASEWQGAKPKCSSQATVQQAQRRQDAGTAAGKKRRPGEPGRLFANSRAVASVCCLLK